MNNSLIDIGNIPHLSIAPGILKLIAKGGEEGENLGIASGSGTVCQAVKNGSYITGRQLLGAADINEIQGSWGSAWVDLGGHSLVLAGIFNGLSGFHRLWGLYPLWAIYIYWNGDQLYTGLPNGRTQIESFSASSCENSLVQKDGE
jgi:hypothetical protein